MLGGLVAGLQWLERHDLVVCLVFVIDNALQQQFMATVGPNADTVHASRDEALAMGLPVCRSAAARRAATSAHGLA